MRQSHAHNSIPYPIHIYSAGNPFPHQAQASYTGPPPSGFPQQAQTYYATPPPSGFFNPGTQGVEHQQPPISLFIFPQPPPFYNPHNPHIGGEGSRDFGNPADQKVDESSALAIVSSSQQEPVTQAVVPTVNNNTTISPEFCSICELGCNSKIVYEQHVGGKKHLRKLALAGLPIPVRQQPVVTVMEPTSSQIARTKRKAAALEDMESKRKKVVQCGAHADKVIVCTPCNVICNNRIVYDIHVKGMKHIRNMIHDSQ